MRDTSMRGTTRWEVQAMGHVGELPTDSIQPTASGIGVTQQWERFIAGGDVDRNYDLVLPKNERAPNRVRFNNTIMLPITTLELDQVHINWPSFVGQPYWWTSGFGRVKSLEVYRIQTDYTDAYIFLYGAGLEDRGLPRNWSGVRTYGQDLTKVFAQNRLAYTTSGDMQYLTLVTGMGYRITAVTSDGFDTAGNTACYQWETVMGFGDPIAFCIGAVRELSSPDRQYFPVQRGSGVNLSLGTIRDWGSSDGNFFVTYNAIPQSDLTIDQTPDLLPAQMQKYLRYYVQARAFERPGEGYRPDLSEHWETRFQRGITLMRTWMDICFEDRIYVREEVGITEMRRVPLVQLPPQYERIW